MKSKLLTILTFALVLVLLALGLASCAPAAEEPVAPEPTEEVAPEPTEEVAPEPTEPPESTTDGPVRGGTIRTEYNWIPYVEDPAADGVGTGLVGLSIAESLVWVGEDGAPQPQLLKAWESNEDASEWTFFLQEDVTFNDGSEFNADDVIWNILHWLDPDTGASAAAKLEMLSPDGIEKVDDLTIKFTLDQANANFLLAFYDYPTMIAPEGGWTDFYSGDPADAIGTGPFLMESFTPDERMVLVANPNYWRIGADGEALPYVEKVIVTAGWDDAARLAAMVAGEADILAPEGGIIEELQKYPDEIDIQYYTTGWITPITMRTDMAPFDDPLVRNAFRLVQDRNEIQELVMPGGQMAYDHWIPSSADAYCSDTDADGRPQDIEGAKALLAQAGYADGIEVDLVIPEGTHRTAFAEVYKEQAAEAGITVNIEILPSSAFWDQWPGLPFMIPGWNGRVPATANMNLALRCGAEWNETYYCNPEFDTLLDQIDATADVDERRELYCQVQKIMQEDSGYIIPFWASTFGASQSNVHLPENEGGQWSRGGFLWHMIWLD